MDSRVDLESYCSLASNIRWYFRTTIIHVEDCYIYANYGAILHNSYSISVRRCTIPKNNNNRIWIEVIILHMVYVQNIKSIRYRQRGCIYHSSPFWKSSKVCSGAASTSGCSFDMHAWVSKTSFWARSCLIVMLISSISMNRTLYARGQSQITCPTCAQR